MRKDKNANSTGPRSRIAERIVELAQSRPDGEVAVWLVYMENHYVTLIYDEYSSDFNFATLVRDDAYEWAWRGHEKHSGYRYRVYRALLRAHAAGTLTLESLEFDSGIPGKHYVAPDDHRWTIEQLLEALEKSESEPPIAPPEGAPTADTERRDRLARPFETPVRIIEGQLEFIESNLSYVEEALQKDFSGSQGRVLEAEQLCRAWRALLAERIHPAVGRLRECLSKDQDPEPALLEIEAMEDALTTYHEFVQRLAAASGPKNASLDDGGLYILVAESGVNIINGWSRIRREAAQIRQLRRV